MYAFQCCCIWVLLTILDTEPLTFSSTRARKAGSSNAGKPTLVLLPLAWRYETISGLMRATHNGEKSDSGHQKTIILKPSY